MGCTLTMMKQEHLHWTTAHLPASESRTTIAASLSLQKKAATQALAEMREAVARPQDSVDSDLMMTPLLLLLLLLLLLPTMTVNTAFAAVVGVAAVVVGGVVEIAAVDSPHLRTAHCAAQIPAAHPHPW